MISALVNGRIFTGEAWFDDHALIIDGDRIRDLVPLAALPADITRCDLGGRMLLPGLFDTQVNGGGGALFNDAPSVATLRTIAAAHRQYGTTALLPTLISDDLAVVEKAIAAVEQAINEKVPGIVGIHLEGPFLNPARKGVHNAEKFRTIDEAAFNLLTSLKVGKTLVTLAPELTTPEIIRRLVDAGVTVAAGHSAADYAQTRAALAAGLSSFTHLFNAMTPFTSREPGMVGAALEDAESYCGIIVDGYHVHPATLKVAVAAKTKGRMVLVTDAMPTVGAANKEFILNGEVIRSENGRCATATGTLAGSDLDMLSAVRNSVALLGLELSEAVRMASVYPAAMMGLENELGSLKPGYKANMILVDDELNLLNSWIDGQPEAR
ncbi:MAG: N-acetylglucosamine-6-phosphate deacetylase [Cellvibrio sp.]